MTEPSSQPSVGAENENVPGEEEEGSPVPSFPPYPPYAVEPVPPSLADTIMAGRDIRVYHKAGLPKKPVRPAPRPARPRGPKATDVKLSKRATRAHTRCLRRHNAVLTDRLEYMSKPHKRRIICLWREHGDMLPADTIARLRSMLDADEPFKPDQAYEYFINLRKTKKRNTQMSVNEVKKDLVAMCADKRFAWARNATVAFARGIQQRLSRPGRYALADGMLRLSNIILNDICSYTHVRTPSRRCTHPKAKFMMEMSDKVAIWIDEILSESDDRMLMMDFDEDDDVMNADEYDIEGFADDFLDMMGGAGGGRGGRSSQQPASEKFTGDMAGAFQTLTNEMYKKGNTPLVDHGKFKQNYKEAADELKTAKNLIVVATNQTLAQQINKELTNTVGAVTPPNLAPAMDRIVEMGANYLAQHAEFNKDKGNAFNLLVKQMKAKQNEPLYEKDKTKRTYAQAAKELESAKNGLETTNDDPNLSQEICAKLAQAVDKVTPPDMKPEMKETVDICSKFLSECAVNESIRAAGGVVTEEGFYIDEHGVRQQISPTDAADDFYIDEDGVRRKKKPGEQTYVDAQGIVRKLKGMAAPVTEEGYYVDENGVKIKMAPGESTDDFYVDANGIRRKKKPGQETYVDAQGIRRLGKPPGPGAMAAPVTEEGYYVDENGVKIKMAPGESADDFYVDANGIRRKKKPGEETYVDAQGIRRQGKAPRPGVMAAPVTEEGYYVDANGVKIKMAPGESTDDFYVDANGIRRKKKPGEETYVDAQGIRRLGKPPGPGAMAAPVTEEGYYIDENGIKIKMAPGESADDFYVDANGIRRKKKPGEETYLDAQGIRRQGKPPGTGAMAAPVTEEGYYVDENGVKIKMAPGESTNDFYVDANGIRRKKKPGEETYVDAQGIRRLGKPPGPGAMAAPVTEQGYHVDENGVKIKMAPGESADDFYVDANGIRRKKKPEEETYVDAQGIRRQGKPPGGIGGVATPGTKAGTTESGYYIDEYGNKKKMGPGENADDYYVDAQGNRKKKKSAGADRGDVDEHGVKRTRKGSGKDVDGSDTEEMETDPDRAAALGILHNELHAKGNATLYKQPHTELSHIQASKWLKKRPRMKVDKTVKESADTARLHKKFERKLGDLVAKKTPTNLQDAMQDVVIESSRILSEYFVAKNYKALVTDGLISEMQKKGNEILVEVGDSSETFFFAAQRLKKATSLEATEPCDRISYFLEKQLDDMIRCRSMARKVIGTMKEHIKESSEYLSEHVTKPDEQIEAYVALLGEMESTGDMLLIEGNIPKSYKSCAAYLRSLTSFDDQINRSNSSLKSSIESKLRSIMTNVVPHGYSSTTLNNVISNSAGLLVSYIMLQGEKTEALKILIDKLTEAGPVVLLRHGTIRKTYIDGADMLRGKNADQLSVSSADPVVARKIQLKMTGLMRDRTPDNYQALMNDVIEDATMYLANYLVQPRMIQVCKCMKNVFVQCELWCDEILRRVTRPCCTCSRHVSAQALAELAAAGTGPLHFAPGSTRAFAPGLEVSVKTCPSATRGGARAPAPCPAPRPTSGCNTASYMLYSASYRRRYTHPPHPPSPTRLESTLTLPDPVTSYYTMYSTSFEQRHVVTAPRFANSDSPEESVRTHASSPACRHSSPPLTPERDARSEPDAAAVLPRADSDSDSDAVRSSTGSENGDELYWRMPPSKFGNASYSRSPTSPLSSISCSPTFLRSPSFPSSSSFPRRSPFPRSASFANSPSFFRGSNFSYNPSTGTTTGKHSSSRSNYETRTPIISTDQMSDWYAMMVSLMWNVQAWRDWIQENIDRALSYQPNPNITRAEAGQIWSNFQRRVAMEALQWRQYNLFSRQLTLRLAFRYRDKHIVSPTRATNRTEIYINCQHEMLEIIDMFDRWTQWLSAVVKETDSLSKLETEVPLHELRWQNFKMKVDEYSEDWNKYNLHLKVCWEQKYRMLIAEWLPAWKQPGPVWVMSACGAVPSGAVAAGIYDSEVIWVARTTHRCNVLPAALHPSKHCCIVYADGAVHHYTKYQVMCNAEAVWLPWRAGAVGARAVRVAPGVHAGRVLYRGSHLLGAVHTPHYRCHVVIFGRPFAFNCYELLVLPEEE